MRNDLKRFGGEIEFSDAEIKVSTYEARLEFLKILNERRPHVFCDLLDLFDCGCLPEHIRENPCSIDTLTNFFLYEIKKSDIHFLDWSAIGAMPGISKMPLIYYFNYLSKKKDGYEKIVPQAEAKWKTLIFIPSGEIIKDEAFKMLIPNWETLQRDYKAKELCQSLANWANKYNINEDWIMDFSLLVLRKIQIKIEKQIDFSNKTFKYTYDDFEFIKKSALGEAMASYAWHEPTFEHNLFYAHRSRVYRKFRFNSHNIKIETQWFPLISLQKDFEAEIEKEFLFQLKEHIDKVCNESENLDSISNILQETDSIIGKFRENLKTYCKKILKIHPKGASKTPEKRTGNKHFEWLIDFQIPPTQEISEIAAENKVIERTVRGGIKDVAEIIDIDLRDSVRKPGRPETYKVPSTKTPRKRGRPKGVKETSERKRYSSW